MTPQEPHHLNPTIYPKATLFVDGQPVATGEAETYNQSRAGAIWPNDRRLLDTVYPQAILKVDDTDLSFPVGNVRRCGSSTIHWDFDFS